MKHRRIVLHMKVVKIFDSFQGEGYNIGLPATFLRLGGCNLNCDFCDTNFNDYKEISVELVKEAVLNHMKNHNTKLLVITGGEPLLQYGEIKKLVNCLNCRVQIETNGSIFRIPLQDTEYVISPKNDVEEVFVFYKEYDKSTFKFLIQSQEDIDLVKQLIYKYDYGKEVYLQPEFGNAEKIVKLILNNRLENIRVSGQLHKYLGVE